MDRKEEQFAHEWNGTMPTMARKTARSRAISSYYEFATYRLKIAMQLAALSVFSAAMGLWRMNRRETALVFRKEVSNAR